MKISGSILAGALMLVSGGAFAQTCASPTVLLSNANVTGDTCGATNELGTVCIFNTSPGNDIIYSFTIVTPYTATQMALTNNTPAWNPALLLLNGACNGNTPCPRNADANGPGGNETLAVDGLQAGNYLMVVTATNADTSCGSFGLTVNGSLPVTLQDFTVS